MSVRCISQVLEKSVHAGTDLLMLIVLADYSDDEGNSYPAVASLARKCRMQPRNANYILKSLQDSGELRVLKNEGPKGCNRYRIMLASLGAKPLQRAAPLQSIAPLQRSAPTPATQCARPLQPIAAEPSLNRQEPSDTSPAKLPTCPIDLIVKTYHEILPELPRVLLMDDSRKKAIRDRCKWVYTTRKPDGTLRAETPEQALAWFKSYFERARDNDFLMGRTPKVDGHKNWKPDIEYLMSMRGLKQVIEKTEVSA